MVVRLSLSCFEYSTPCNSSKLQVAWPERLRFYVKAVTEPSRVEAPSDRELQPQPVDVLLLGSALKGFGDPDWAVMAEYAVGVPLGLGVDLPRTPDVFPE